MDVVPKNAKEFAKFLNCWAPSRSQIFEHSYGYLMVTEVENFAVSIATMMRLWTF